MAYVIKRVVNGKEVVSQHKTKASAKKHSMKPKYHETAAYKKKMKDKTGTYSAPDAGGIISRRKKKQESMAE